MEGPEEGPIPGFGFRFRCQRSGNCCSIPGGFVRVTSSEVEALAQHLEIDTAAFRSRYLTAAGDRLVDGTGGRCVFLRDGRTTACGVYQVRPGRCRSWPFWPELRDDPAAVARAQRLCPGIETVTD
jgi:Fe-S-cluster containining protein